MLCRSVSHSSEKLYKRMGNKWRYAFQVAESRKLVHLHENELHLVRDLSGSRASAITDSVLYTVTQTGRVSTALRACVCSTHLHLFLCMFINLISRD